jgi:phenazine biosynthesis protein PhzF family protein
MKQYIVDAFTDKIFCGNQAAVCVLDQWLSEELMMNITRENNFSETAFTVKTKDGYDLRWFTPGGEINLCGHATLATSYVLFRFYEPDLEQIIYHTMSGDLFVSRKDDYIMMDFPIYECKEVPVTEQMVAVMGAALEKTFLDRDLLLVYDDERVIRGLQPDFEAMRLLDGSGVGVTAPGIEYDCVSRFFAPKLKVNEDPVTGSVHCMIVPYWAERLGKHNIRAYQASERGGELFCELNRDRVIIAGKAALYAVSELNL